MPGSPERTPRLRRRSFGMRSVAPGITTSQGLPQRRRLHDKRVLDESYWRLGVEILHEQDILQANLAETLQRHFVARHLKAVDGVIGFRKRGCAIPGSAGHVSARQRFPQASKQRPPHHPPHKTSH